MSVTAYVLIECVKGGARDVAEAVSKIGGVRVAHPVTGPYDVIAVVSASNFKVLGDVLMKRIQGVEGVIKTLTNVVIE